MHIQMTRLYEAADKLTGAKTQAEVARMLNASSQTINNWEARGISKAGMLSAQKIIGCSATWLETGDGEMVFSSSSSPDPSMSEMLDSHRLMGAERSRAVRGSVDGDPFAAIRKVKLQLSAGATGFQTEPDDDDGDTLIVPTAWLRRKGFDARDLIATTVKGESMETTFHEGDIVVIHTKDTKLVDGSVYAVNYEGEALIKRLSRDAGDWWLTSDNPDQRKYHRKICRGSACIVIGRVVRSESEQF